MPLLGLAMPFAQPLVAMKHSRSFFPCPPSLAIVDCHLPDRSGLSIMRLTLGAGGGIPFVLVTGEPELPDGAAGLSNAVMFWRKPLDMSSLVDLVKSLIGTGQKPAA